MFITEVSTQSKYYFNQQNFWKEESTDGVPFSSIKSIEKLEETAGIIFFKVILNDKKEYVFKAEAKEYLAFYEGFLNKDIVQKEDSDKKPDTNEDKQSSTEQESGEESDGKLWLMASLFIIGPILVFLIVRGEGFSSAENFCSKEYAIMYAEDFVRNNLKSPSSAEFPGWSSFNVQNIGKCEFIVMSYVDAQNSFGATIRSNFTVRLKMNQDESWRLLDFEMY